MATVRPAEIHDVVEIHHLIENYASMGNLLPRPINELYRHLRDFFVVIVDDRVIACGALEIFTETLGEVRSLVVEDRHKDHGYGRLLVEKIIDEARHTGLRQLMALTYAPAFFHKIDFDLMVRLPFDFRQTNVRFDHCLIIQFIG